MNNPNIVTQVLVQFVVLCVTKLSSKKAGVQLVCKPLQGPAKLVLVTNKEFADFPTEMNIHFMGNSLTFLRAKAGLNGTAVTLVAEVEEGPYDTWELHTDVPLPGFSIEMVRHSARTELEEHG